MGVVERVRGTASGEYRFRKWRGVCKGFGAVESCGESLELEHQAKGKMSLCDSVRTDRGKA